MSGDADPRDLLAAEFAFGLLDGDERAAAQAREAVDAAFAAEVVRWRALAGDLFPEEVPRPSLWADIARRLPANDDSRPVQTGAHGARRWQFATAAMGALALGLGVHALRQPARIEQPMRPATVAAAPHATPFVAVLRGDDERAAIAVTFDRDANRLTIMPSAVPAAQGSIELWVIGADGAPRSLGLIDAGRSQLRSASPRVVPALAPGSTIAVTREAPGGSATGQPTSKPFLAGTLART